MQLSQDDDDNYTAAYIMSMKAAVNRKINLTTKHIIHRKIMMNKVYKSLLLSAAK